jgi:hypothetical protein
MDALHMGPSPKPPAVLGTSGTIRRGGQSLTATASDERLGFLGFGIFWVLILIRYHLVIQHSHGKSPFVIGKPSISMGNFPWLC